VADIIQATGLAAASMAEAAEGLTIDEARMRANIDATRGAIFAERAMILLGASLGRDVAHQLLEEATQQSLVEGRRLVEVLSEMPEVARHLDSEALRNLEAPEHYLGAAHAFRKQLLSPSKRKDS
jgi:3-carboxy-cis,cis-muconate cycloisomerase